MCIFKTFRIKLLNKKITLLQKERAHSQPSEARLAQEVASYHQLAQLYQKVIGKKKFPFAHVMVRACYRKAATLDDSAAQYLVGKSLLDEAKYRESLEQRQVFASRSNQRAVQQLYEEAHAYLLAATNLKHIEAKRLRGLCLINGWGMPQDTEAGFQLIVASIDEAQAWDQVTQIFRALGINKPEFYHALIKHRHS